jgi:DNA invertase Pin-like site-specific DNA recombinase
LRSQHAANIACAATHDWSIPDDPAFHFSDDGASGSTSRREALDALVAQIQSGEAPFARVYMRDRTRLLRNSDPRARFWFEHVMEMHGVRVIYATDAECSEERTERRAARGSRRLSVPTAPAPTSDGGAP